MAGTLRTDPQLWLDGLNIPHEFEVPLAPKTWYGVGGNAAVLAHPSSIAQLAALVKRCHEREIPLRVLGSGANLLVRDEGVQGVVVQLDDAGFKALQRRDNIIAVGAGFDLMKLVLETAKMGLGGLEAVAGIPASVGGAVRMNAGGAYGDIGATVRRVQVMSESGQTYSRGRDDLIFSYRRTNIVAPFIVEVEFDLAEDDPDELMKRVKEIFMYKKTTQPMGESSAGCAFKNPRHAAGEEAWEDLPMDAAGRPLSAGALIDRAGLKGHRIGGAEVSQKHANFVFTRPGATAADVLALMEHVGQVVEEQFGVRLEREVVVWP